MNLLFVFNDDFKIEEFTDLCEKFKIKEVSLFPLTSAIEINRKIIACCNNIQNLKVIVLNSARIIDEQVTIIRNEICRWSAHLGENKIGAKTVKEWLLLPGLNVSSWWFSLLSEKNNYKTDAFFQIAQVNAVRHIIRNRKYDICVGAISDIAVCESFFNLFEKEGLDEIYFIGSQHGKKLTDRKFSEGSTLSVYLKEIKAGIYALRRTLQRSLVAKKQLGKMRRRLKNIEDESLLFVSYFPALDKEAAKEGVFVNQYTGPLQEKLGREKNPIIWLLMFVYLGNYQFKDAIKFVKSFVKQGERVFLLEEFFKYTDTIRALFLWIRQICISLFLFRYIEKTRFDHPSFELLLHKPIVKRLWLSSFFGTVGMEGIIFSLIFRNTFKRINKIKSCLYYCEMHAWEKALNAAKNNVNKMINTIGFQHVSIAKNYFHYFYDTSETVMTGQKTEMPLPDVLACNGEIMYSLLSKSNYPCITKVEAIRQLYLADIISKPYKTREGQPILLVAGSILEHETQAIVELVHYSLGDNNGLRIDFKGHPAMPMEKIFNNIRIDPKSNDYNIRNDNISKCLEDAWIVLVPSTTVSIEALAYGCEVIIPVFPNSMLMNPLADFNDFYHRVISIEDLADVVGKIVGGFSKQPIDKYRTFVKEYFNLDPNLPGWENLLREVNVNKGHKSVKI